MHSCSRIFDGTVARNFAIPPWIAMVRTRPMRDKVMPTIVMISSAEWYLELPVLAEADESYYCKK